jgi:hypothetical protein
VSANGGHPRWCSQINDAGHTTCTALLGRVVVGGSTRVDIQLSRALEGPTVAALTVHGRTGHDRTVVLNVETAYLLEALLRQAVSLMTT